MTALGKCGHWAEQGGMAPPVAGGGRDDGARDIFLGDNPGEAAVSAQLKMLARDHGVTLVPLDEAMRRNTPALIAAR